MNPDGSDISIFTTRFNTTKHIIQPETVNTEQTLICFRASIKPYSTREYLMFYGKKSAVTPVYAFGDTNYHFDTGHSGDNIRSWRRDTLEQDGNIRPVFGRFMQKVAVTIKPSGGNHATNEKILFPGPIHDHIFIDSFLEYDIRSAQNSSIRAVVCAALEDGEYTWNNPAVDNEGYSADWRTDLNPVIHDKWYHRRIPMYRFQNQLIKSLCFMVNDYPDLKRVPQFETFTFYFDNLRITRGDPPVIDIEHKY
jgi:hypothetical protein